MNFKELAESKKETLTDPQQVLGLNFLCSLFSNKIQEIVDSSKKLRSDAYYHIRKPKDIIDSPRELHVIFTIDTNGDYSIDNFSFDK